MEALTAARAFQPSLFMARLTSLAFKPSDLQPTEVVQCLRYRTVAGYIAWCQAFNRVSDVLAWHMDYMQTVLTVQGGRTCSCYKDSTCTGLSHGSESCSLQAACFTLLLVTLLCGDHMQQQQLTASGCALHRLHRHNLPTHWPLVTCWALSSLGNSHIRCISAAPRQSLNSRLG